MERGLRVYRYRYACAKGGVSMPEIPPKSSKHMYSYMYMYDL